jgi:hypothetical protein
VLISIS